MSADTNTPRAANARWRVLRRHLTINSPVGDLHWPSAGAQSGACLIGLSGVLLATLLPSYIPHTVTGLATLIIYGSWTSWNTVGLGLRLTPIQGWRYWLGVAVVLGAIVGLTCSIAWLCALALGVYIFVPQIDPSYPPVRAWLIHLLILAPFLEELVYRFALCVPIVRRIGSTWAIVLSGAVFALAHIIGGNPGPDNFVAGFLLAWAFLKSGTLLIPVFLHLAGNLCVFIFGVLMFYWPVFMVAAPK